MHNTHKKLPGCRGVTLIELLVAMSVLTILLAVGVPSFGQFTANTRLNSYANTMFSHLALARSEAIKRNTRVVICKSPDGSTCAGSGNWNQGWIVFADLDNSGSINGGEQIIAATPALSTGFSFSGDTDDVSSYISYDALGMTKLTSGGFQFGRMTLCPAAPAVAGNGREIILFISGGSRIAKITTCS